MPELLTQFPHNIVPEQKETDIYTNGDLTIFFKPSPFEERWIEFGDKSQIDPLQAREIVAEILTPSFVKGSLRILSPSFNRPISEAEVQLIQQGHKNSIYLVTAAYRDFIFVLSRGTALVNQQLWEDFNNLRSLRSELQKAHISPFVPQVTMIGEHLNVPGYSSEYLGRHIELSAHPNLDLLQQGQYFTEFRMNGQTDKAETFNSQSFENGYSNPKGKDRYKKTHDRIKQALAARLSIIHKVTGGQLPREFRVNAGDFMADPFAENFDLQLITVRGGWEHVPDNEVFDWMMSCQESVNVYSNLTDFTTVIFPLFDNNTDIINKGISEGRRVLAGDDN